jgi:hypothetical protein
MLNCWVVGSSPIWEPYIRERTNATRWFTENTERESVRCFFVSPTTSRLSAFTSADIRLVDMFHVSGFPFALARALIFTGQHQNDMNTLSRSVLATGWVTRRGCSIVITLNHEMKTGGECCKPSKNSRVHARRTQHPCSHTLQPPNPAKGTGRNFSPTWRDFHTQFVTNVLKTPEDAVQIVVFGRAGCGLRTGFGFFVLGCFESTWSTGLTIGSDSLILYAAVNAIPLSNGDKGSPGTVRWEYQNEL